MFCFISSVFFINTFLMVNSHDRLLVNQLRWDFLILEDELWSSILNYSRGGFNETDDPGITFIEKFYNFDQKMQQMPDDVLYGLQVVQQAPLFLFVFSDLRVVHDMYDKLRRTLANSLEKYKTGKYGYHQELMIAHIIDDVLYDSKNNVNKTLLNIYQRIFINDNNENMIYQVFDIISRSDYLCKNFNQPAQQVVYNLYNTIALTELKGYILTQFSYLAQRIEERGNYTEASLLARKQYQQRVNESLSSLQAIITLVPAALWRCDPPSYIKGKTYDELTGLIQGHIENEVDLNNHGTCRENCQVYSLAENHGCYDSDADYCRKRKPCAGRILNCRFIESHMTACISPVSSPRRFEYIEYDSGRVLGRKTRCYNRKINSWFRWFVHCSYCFCLCDQQGLSSDRYFNLRPVMADVANNRVVTGLRIVKHNRIIHLQIQEGKLLSYGYIDNSTVRWVPVDDYKITDTGVQNAEDFHTMDYKTRDMFLDDLRPHEADHIITGVRFEFIDNYLRFEINVRGFNFENGTLSKDSYYIYGTQPRQRINIDDTDIPTYSPPSEPTRETNKYIRFTHTSIDKDAAQTTVPFFDIQPVASYPAVPLEGAGIYYKGIRGYGGFLAPKITTYNFNKHSKMDFPEVQLRDDSEDELLPFPA